MESKQLSKYHFPEMFLRETASLRIVAFIKESDVNHPKKKKKERKESDVMVMLKHATHPCLQVCECWS